MASETHYRATNNLRISQLQQRTLTLIEDKIKEIIIPYYEGTVTVEGDIYVPIFHCLTNFLRKSYNQSKLRPTTPHLSATNAK